VLLALTSNQKLGLGLTAAVFISFSLLSALVIPRWRPDFPGRGLAVFVVLTLILMIAMLGAVEVFAKEAEHGEAAAETTTPETTETQTTQTQTTTTAPTTTAAQPPGSPQAGRAVFVASGCGACHTFTAAGASGTVGPNLDQALKGKDAAFIHESIVDPNKEITSGYSAGVMPQNFGQQLSEKQLDDLVAFLTSS
jgi:mono/diheme cytochrome c family protein